MNNNGRNWVFLVLGIILISGFVIAEPFSELGAEGLLMNEGFIESVNVINLSGHHLIFQDHVENRIIAIFNGNLTEGEEIAKQQIILPNASQISFFGSVDKLLPLLAL